MDRLRQLLRPEQPYEPIEDRAPDEVEGGEDGDADSLKKQRSFSYIDYAIFLLLGISMLWAWNMFLAAGPYFNFRFRHNAWISENFQAAEVSVSTVTNLASMLVLTKLQAGASYPRRIIISLLINIATFALLTASTAFNVGAGGYFGFLMVMILSTSLATGFCQNGVFAYASGFGEPRYTQAIMTGQAIAGVLPCIAQIVSVLSVQSHDEDNTQHARGDKAPAETEPATPGPAPVSPWAAFAYFLTAAVIAAVTLLAFFYQLGRYRQYHNLPKSQAPKHDQHISTPIDPANPLTASDDEGEEEDAPTKTVALSTLLRKLFWLAGGVFLTFAITLASFPVFTQRITSVLKPSAQPPLLQPPAFIPLAFLMWNIGDLVGRLLTAVPRLSLTQYPRLVFLLAMSRAAWIGLYHLCNIRGRGAVVESDFFYLVIVQMLFGLTNGFLGSTCMIGAGEWVEESEREAAGGFMGLSLVGGLAVGSLASFFAANV
ncbi:hypothetical protein K431DRAFT_284190 [Polychaeton citri CBS 116435]|uniref:Nucleoside transporter n=1 Tax=Polychaeton citri CBS 116435 TaxID=1314669 RepID=A0A9P4QC48_9PEZI|nr:hypothetical protein K431DRAFT_284190 [Polychaeton citri CBS 116435]